jgi:hypothetical protein
MHNNPLSQVRSSPWARGNLPFAEDVPDCYFRGVRGDFASLDDSFI